MTKTVSPPPKPPRVSVPLSLEALDVFQRLAKAGNMSTGRAIAEWLDDTAEAAGFMASTMERARAAPKVVMREMHAYALGLADETGELMRSLAEKGKTQMKKDATGPGRRRSVAGRGGILTGAVPPPSNTGGKPPQNTGKPRRSLKPASSD